MNCYLEMSRPTVFLLGDGHGAVFEAGKCPEAGFWPPQKCGLSCSLADGSGTSTRTIPDSMRVRYAATQAGSASGLVTLPVSRSIFHACRGQTTVLPVTIPSANGPPL